MKISKIHIHDYFQFQDLELDLTYPKGHEKEGQPLDKVCLIGQSGTGKTTILKLFAELIEILTPIDEMKETLRKGQRIDFFFEDSKGSTKKVSLIGSDNGSAVQYGPNFSEKKINKVLYFPTNQVSINITPISPNYSLNDRLHKFDEYGLVNLWTHSKNELAEYQLDEADLRVGLTIESEKNNSLNIIQRIKEWKKTNPNPLEVIAQECLDPILNRFHLAVQTEIINFRKADFLQIRSQTTNEIVPYNNLSTGTRQVIYKAYPLYRMLEPNSIILMDEPENSLYPDIQKEIINYYTSFDKEKESQFFFATHSPIIASSFEPWEIVELKFDAEGKIYRELYYEGENHVDNYRIDPRYLRWDQILTKVFDMQTDSNEKREEKLIEFAILKREIEHLEREGKLENQTKEIQNLVEKFMQVGNQLEWETDKYLAHAENQ